VIRRSRDVELSAIGEDLHKSIRQPRPPKALTARKTRNAAPFQGPLLRNYSAGV
jgi:hypothetical protein